MTFTLLVVIALLVVYIIGFKGGTNANRVTIGGDNSYRESDSGSLSWLFILAVIAGALYFLAPEDLRITNLGQINFPKKEAPTNEGDNSNTEQETFYPGSSQENSQEPNESETSESFEQLEKNLEAETEEYQAVPVYIIQTGAFGTEKNRDDELTKLRASGLKVTDIYADTGLYHVGYGPFDSKEAAERYKARHGLKGIIRLFYI
ncbi:MAG: SPOR domain-containing protein [Bacteroidota bacterium]